MSPGNLQAHLPGVLQRLKGLFQHPMAAEGILGKKIRDAARSRGILTHTTGKGEDTAYLSHAGESIPKFLQPFLPDTGIQNPDRAWRLMSLLKNFPRYITGYADETGGKVPKSWAQHDLKNPGLIMSPSGASQKMQGGDLIHVGKGLSPTEKLLKKQYPEAETFFPRNNTPAPDDKLWEAAHIKHIPATERLDKIIGRTRNPKAIAAALEKKFGPNWILKARESNATSADQIITENTPAADLLRWLRESGKRTTLLGQKRTPMKELGPVAKWFDGLHHPSHFMNRGTREVRVHTVNGKVVPYGSVERGSVFHNLKDIILPWRSSTVRNAETYAQKVLDDMPQNLRNNTTYGFDVGISTKGKPFLIETNPSSAGSASGFFDHALTNDALSGAIRGQLPNWVKAKRSVAGAAGVGGIGAASSSLSPVTPPIPQPNPLQIPTPQRSQIPTLSQFLNPFAKSGAEKKSPSIAEWGQLAGAGLAADTAVSGVKAIQLGDRMIDFHETALQNPKALRSQKIGVDLLREYTSNAQKALNLRIAGLPVGMLPERLPISTIFKGGTPAADILRHAIGLGSTDELAEAGAHYKQFRKNPFNAQAQEIISEGVLPNSPLRHTSPGIRKAISQLPTEGVARFEAIGRNPLFKKSIQDQVGELFLGGYSPMTKHIPLDAARNWGSAAYGRLLRNTGRGILPAAALAALGLGYSSGIPQRLFKQE